MPPQGQRPRCFVVGGGVVGVLTALRLADRDAEVTVFEAATPGAGTSGTTYSHVNASYAGYWPYFDLRAAGVAGYRQLRQELGATPWWRDTGHLLYEHDPGSMEALDAHARRLAKAGYAVRAEPVGFVREHLEPAVVPGASVEHVLHFPDEGYVEMALMLTDLLREGRRRGVQVRSGTAVTALHQSGERVTGVELGDGSIAEADVVITCAGRGTDALLASVGTTVPVLAPEPHDDPESPVPGLLCVTTPVVEGPTRVVIVDGLNIRPDGGGRVMLWSGALDARMRTATTSSPADRAARAELASEALAWGTRYVPALSGASIEAVLPAMRVMPVDGLPIVGWMPRTPGLYVMVAHAAVTLAPALSLAAAAEVCGATADVDLERFRPDRLFEAH